MRASTEQSSLSISTNYAPVWHLTLAGAVAGVLSMALPLRGLFLGVWLGTATVVYLWALRGLRSLIRGLGFIAVSTAAYYVAFVSAIWLPLRIPLLDVFDTGSFAPHADSLLFGGIIGDSSSFLEPFCCFSRP